MLIWRITYKPILIETNQYANPILSFIQLNKKEKDNLFIHYKTIFINVWNYFYIGKYVVFTTEVIAISKQFGISSIIMNL